MAHLKIRCTVDGHVLLPGEDHEYCPVCGERQWEYLCEASGEHFRGEACPWCAYVFQGNEFEDTTALARAFVKNWDFALRALHENPPSRWVRVVLGDTVRADRMNWLDADPDLEPHHRLSLTVALLDPLLPLIWEGAECDEAKMAENPHLALMILESQMPRCCRLIGSHEWLPGLEARWRGAIHAASECLPISAPHPSPQGILSFVLGNTSALGMTEALPLSLFETCLRASEFSTTLQSRPKRRSSMFASPPSAFVPPSAAKSTTQTVRAPSRLQQSVKTPSISLPPADPADHSREAAPHGAQTGIPSISKVLAGYARSRKVLLTRFARWIWQFIRRAASRLCKPYPGHH